MDRQMRFFKIAKGLVIELTEELVKLLLRNRTPDLYYSLETKIMEAMNAAYNEGYKKGRKEVLDEVVKFDESKDQVGS